MLLMLILTCEWERERDRERVCVWRLAPPPIAYGGVGSRCTHGGHGRGGGGGGGGGGGCDGGGEGDGVGGGGLHTTHGSVVGTEISAPLGAPNRQATPEARAAGHMM